MAEREAGVARDVAAGVSLSLAGVVLVELLLYAGARPLTPLGWPALGLIAATALYGAWGLAGGASITLAYFLFNATERHRFPEFYSAPQLALAWFGGIALMCAVIMVLRTRLLAAQRRVLLDEAQRKADARLRLATETLPALVGYVDRDERLRLANRTYERWFGVSRDHLLGKTLLEAWGQERYHIIQPSVARALRGEHIQYEYRLPDSTGRERQILADYLPDIDPSGVVNGFFVLGTDITAIARTRQELELENERLEHALESSRAALWDTDLRTGRVYLSEGWAQIVGAPPGETITTTAELSAMTHPDDLEKIRKAASDAVKGVLPGYSVEHRVKTVDGEWRWILSRGRVTERDPQNGRASRMIGMNLDITERKHTEHALESEARTDPLTGLANRTMLADRMQLAMARSQRGGWHCAVLYLDLDRFKEVNDTHGHAAGDAALKEFATRLSACVRQTDTVARVGGDEFVVLLEGLKEPGHAMLVASKILEKAREPLMVNDRAIGILTSIGIAHVAGHATQAAWLEHADKALYAAKSAGRNTMRVGS